MQVKQTAHTFGFPETRKTSKMYMARWVSSLATWRVGEVLPKVCFPLLLSKYNKQKAEPESGRWHRAEVPALGRQGSSPFRLVLNSLCSKGSLKLLSLPCLHLKSWDHWYGSLLAALAKVTTNSAPFRETTTLRWMTGFPQLAPCWAVYHSAMSLQHTLPSMWCARIPTGRGCCQPLPLQVLGYLASSHSQWLRAINPWSTQMTIKKL